MDVLVDDLGFGIHRPANKVKCTTISYQVMP